jgi:hypothetical protein
MGNILALGATDVEACNDGVKYPMNYVCLGVSSLGDKPLRLIN